MEDPKTPVAVYGKTPYGYKPIPAAFNLFSFGEHQVRTELVDPKDPGSLVFVNADLCEVLGIANASHALTRIDPESVHRVDLPTSKGDRTINCVDVGGMFQLILLSRLESAEKFKRWVCNTVLPSIMRAGHYGHSGPVLEQLRDTEIMLREKEQKALREEALALEANENRKISEESYSEAKKSSQRARVTNEFVPSVMKLKVANVATARLRRREKLIEMVGREYEFCVLPLTERQLSYD